MRINKHIQQLDYPEYASLSFEDAGVNLAQHMGKNKKYDYALSQDKVLINRIAKLENLKAENILVTSSADAGLHHIAEAFLDEGKIAVIPLPAFGRFEFHTKVVGAQEIFVKHTKFPYSFDLKRVTRLAKEKNADLIFIANPNNPTGELIKKRFLKQFIKENVNRMVVVDEVLIEEIEDSVSKYVNEYKNLIVVKSFSKLFGVPGLRIGYILASPQLRKIIGKTVSPYEASSLSLYVIKKMLRDENYTRRMIKKFRQARNLLKKTLPLPLSNTEAAVGLIDGGRRSVYLFDYLLKHGILTVDGRNFRGLEDTNTARVIITNTRDMERLVRGLNKYKKQL